MKQENAFSDSNIQAQSNFSDASFSQMSRDLLTEQDNGTARGLVKQSNSQRKRIRRQESALCLLIGEDVVEQRENAWYREKVNHQRRAGGAQECQTVKLPIGLKLSRTQSLLDLLQETFSQATKATPTETETEDDPSEPETQRRRELAAAQHNAEKLKASSIPANLLEINSWVRVSQREGDVVAKCYYARQKLVWEVMDHSLKSKIEIQWSDISAIRATFSENQPDALEVELQRMPQFFQESDPQPRKHTLWHVTGDFTGGQAIQFRRHRLEFRHGTFERHYEKLLSCDSRLFNLSRMPFPSHSPPFKSSLEGQHQNNVTALKMHTTEPRLPYHAILPSQTTRSGPSPPVNGSDALPSLLSGLTDEEHMVSRTANQTQDMSFPASNSQLNPSFPNGVSQAMFASNTLRDSQAMFASNNQQFGETSRRMASIPSMWPGDKNTFPESNQIHSQVWNTNVQRIRQYDEYTPVHAINDYWLRSSEIGGPSATRLLQLQSCATNQIYPFSQVAPSLSSKHVSEQLVEDEQKILLSEQRPCILKKI